MNYPQVVQWMFRHLPMYQNVGKQAYTGKLENFKKLLHHLGNPHLHFKSIHVAGTNGKGSACHMLAAVLQKSGYKTGLYTSPHLVDFRERIRINGQMIPQKNVVHFIENHRSFLEHHFSFFEISAAMAFSFFKQQKVDIAVIEVGLGGRLDSTNVITPLACAITNIGLDHTDILGDTLEKIAAEKAGIIKKNVPVVVGAYQPEIWHVFEKIAREKKANLYCAEQKIKQLFATDLQGACQKNNVKTAYQVLKILQKLGYEKITKHTLREGFLQVVAQTGLQGRWQVLQQSHPKIVCDTAHNKAAFEYIAENLKQEKKAKLHMVLGFVKDKNISDILELLPQQAYYYFCKPDLDRAMPLESLAKITQILPFKNFYSTCEAAYQQAKYSAGMNDFIYVGGSTFVVAEIITKNCSN